MQRSFLFTPRPRIPAQAVLGVSGLYAPSVNYKKNWV